MFAKGPFTGGGMLRPRGRCHCARLRLGSRSDSKLTSRLVYTCVWETLRAWWWEFDKGINNHRPHHSCADDCSKTETLFWQAYVIIQCTGSLPQGRLLRGTELVYRCIELAGLLAPGPGT